MKRRFKTVIARWYADDPDAKQPSLLNNHINHPDRYYLRLAPCLLHLWHLGLTKKLWKAIGDAIGRDNRDFLNKVLSQPGSFHNKGLASQLHCNIWSEAIGEPMGWPGRFWKLLTNNAPGFFQLMLPILKGRDPGKAPLFDNILVLLRKTFWLQELLYQRSYDANSLEILGKMIFDWKSTVVQTLPGSNWKLPNFDNCTCII